MQKLLLFDIDGTLIHGGSAGRRALDRACQVLYGRQEASKGFRFDGKTDRAIVREMYASLTGEPLETAERNRVEATLTKVLDLYLTFLPEAVERAERYKILPGVPALLERLAAQKEMTLGLATGNLEKGARIKLERAGLNAFFPFGGFGCDSELRSQLVAKAIHRAKELSGSNLAFDLPNEQIYLIGDTHHDVNAGKAVGVKTVAVATGSFSTQELAKSKPDFLFENFANVEKTFNFFQSENS